MTNAEIAAFTLIVQKSKIGRNGAPKSLTVNGERLGKTTVRMEMPEILLIKILRSYAYRWGEEGIAGFSCISDQILCLAPAFWNGNDPILKDDAFSD